MFWSHQNQEPAETFGRYLREELRLRLRVAADFATLGAYELSELEHVDGAEDAPQERAVTEAPPKRVLLFAKVAPVCPHSAPAGPACERPPRRRPRAGHAARQRGGSVRAPEQPCVCSDGRPVGV
jgi:hypothetical protein